MNIKLNHQRLSWILFLFLLSSSASFLFAFTPPEGEVTIKVTGMVCGGCEAKVEATLKNIRGIHQVEANHKKKTVLVRYNFRIISIDAIIQAITHLGYGVPRVN